MKEQESWVKMWAITVFGHILNGADDKPMLYKDKETALNEYRECCPVKSCAVGGRLPYKLKQVTLRY